MATTYLRRTVKFCKILTILTLADSSTFRHGVGDTAPEATLPTPDPFARQWYPAVPCCPHCQSNTSSRSLLASCLCTTCAKIPGVKARAEHVPPLIGPKGYEFFQKKPIAWLAYQLGKSGLRAIPPQYREREARRLMHIAIVRFWGDDDDIDITYDILRNEARDPWQQDGTVGGGMDSFQPSEDSEVVRDARSTHHLYVRIFRNKLNTAILKPLLAWLADVRVQMASTTIARSTTVTDEDGWVPSLMLMGDSATGETRSWAVTFVNTQSAFVVVLNGRGVHFPDTLATLTLDGEPLTEQAFSRAALEDVLRG